MTETSLKQRPSTLSKEEFLEIYGGIYESSPHYAQHVWETMPHRALDTVEALFQALKTKVDRASTEAKLDLIRAHPDLASRPGVLSAHSMAEQTSAGLVQSSDSELKEFAALNSAYKEKFGFPFIVAVRGLSRADIMAQFRRRIGNDRETEFATALNEIHKIAHLRLLNLA
jgi:2-oxo-4-hydroxy-4-carboxy-5-ureidoimidazoline decarboxylase